MNQFKYKKPEFKLDIQNLPVIRHTSSKWTLKDFVGSVRVRAGFSRNHYTMDPGLYAMGNPDKNSDVMVTSNYKLTFDIVRRDLDSLNVWILVLDTRGINVWCAAGKGTFGTDELVNRIKIVNLGKVVDHRKIILPQLGAVGVASHVVKEKTGFKAVFGPVRSSDIEEFLKSGYSCDETMRTVEFSVHERIKLTPVEMVMSFKYLPGFIFLILLISGFSATGFSFADIQSGFIKNITLSLSAYLSGTFLTPVLLPWLPFRGFAAKGALMGLLIWIIASFSGIFSSAYESVSWMLIFLAISSFLGMNFTGASTYTSLSGVKKEMKYALPAQIAAILLGVGICILSKFVN